MFENFIGSVRAFMSKQFGVSKTNRVSVCTVSDNFDNPYLILDKNAGACIGAEAVMQAFQERKRCSMSNYSVM